MKIKGLNPRGAGFWIRVGILVLAFAGILSVIGYFQSGEFAREPGVQAFLGSEESRPERKARLLIDSASPTPSVTPSSP